MRPIKTRDHWQDAATAPLAIVYKHSAICNVSSGAVRAVTNVETVEPDVPVYVIDVLAQRDLSMEVAADTGVLHQSPQLLLLAEGVPLWHTSHFGIQEEAIRQALRAARHASDPEAGDSEGPPMPETPTFAIPRWGIYGAVAALVAMLAVADRSLEPLLWAAGALIVVSVLRNARLKQRTPEP